MGAVAALCAWLAPLWLTILLTTLVTAGMIAGWVAEDLRAKKEPVRPAS